MSNDDDERQLEKEPLKFFQSSPFLATTIGIPFCAFKFLFGMLALRIGEERSADWLAVFGVAVVIWALIDFLMNSFHVVKALAGTKVRVEYCLLAQFGGLFKRQTLFLAVDTLISFAIICFTLWSGWIAKLTPLEAKLWCLATTINLVSLAAVSIIVEYYENSDRFDERK